MKHLALLLCVFFLASPAFAQSADAAAAEALFSQGVELMEAGNFEEGCPKLAESQRLDPGTGTLGSLAECYEKAGKLASAWTTWKTTASSAKSAGQSDREAYAREQAAALEPRLGRLTIHVPEDKRPDGLTVERDGVVLSAATWGTPLPTDAGQHTIVVQAPGREKFETSAMVEDGKTAEVTIPELVLLPEPPPEEPTTTTGTSSQPKDKPANPGAWMKPVGFTLLGVGVVGLGLGTVFGIVAIDKNNQSRQNCDVDDPTNCSTTGFELRNEAMTAGNVSTVGFIAGAVLAGAGAYFVIASPKKAKASAAIEPTLDGARLVLSGAF